MPADAGTLSLLQRPLKPSRAGTLVIYLFLAAQVIRMLTHEGVAGRYLWYGGLSLAYLALFTLVLLKPVRLHLYFTAQSFIILVMFSLNPEMDLVVSFFVSLSYQMALVFTGRTLWAWVGGLALITAGALMASLGALQGLAISLPTIAGVILLPAYVIVNHELETARAQSQILLAELQATHQQLEVYAGQVEELAAIETRNHLARELHDTVSQFIFSILLTNRSAQLLLEREPAHVPEQLKRLQELTGQALSQLRALITQLRPPQKS